MLTPDPLTHCGRVTHISVGNLTIIGSDNGLSPGRRQAIIWTNAGILLTWHLGTNFSQILIEIHTFSFKKIHLKMSSGKWRPFCLGLNVLRSLYSFDFLSNTSQLSCVLIKSCIMSRSCEWIWIQWKLSFSKTTNIYKFSCKNIRSLSKTTFRINRNSVLQRNWWMVDSVEMLQKIIS